VGGTVWTVLALGLAAVGSTAVSALAAPTGVAGADPIADCSTTTGVIVVVDFSPWDGAIERGCDGSLTTGYDALQRAGFTTTGTEQEGAAFVCRILDPANGVAEPPATEDPCVSTPPANAYWSFWYAPAGDTTTWQYSQQGAMDFEPTAGSTDAWVFGGDNPPTVLPKAVQATNVGPTGTTPPPPPTSPSPTSAPSAPTSVGGSTSGTGPGSTPSGAPGSSHTASSSSSVPRGSTTTSTTTTKGTVRPGGTAGSGGSPSPSTGAGSGSRAQSSSEPRILNVTPSSAVAHPSAGSPLPFVLGAVVVAGLAGGAGLVARRRRRAD
jgi:hypothetical protein